MRESVCVGIVDRGGRNVYGLPQSSTPINPA